MIEDIVIEVKMRLSGLTYDEAAEIRDALRRSDDISMGLIVDEMKLLAKEIAPHAQVEVFSPWAEWRPAQGKRKSEPR